MTRHCMCLGCPPTSRNHGATSCLVRVSWRYAEAKRRCPHRVKHTHCIYFLGGGAVSLRLMRFYPKMRYLHTGNSGGHRTNSRHCNPEVSVQARLHRFDDGCMDARVQLVSIALFSPIRYCKARISVSPPMFLEPQLYINL